MNYFWTADFHLNHKNVIKYSQRPFKDVEEMNETIISNWNKVVKNEDIVYFLGDYAFGNAKFIAETLRQLKGNIKFLWGNHEKPLKQFARGISNYPDLQDRLEFLGDYKEVKINEQFIVMCHYAFKVWNKSHFGSWNLFAHSHGSLKDDINSLSIDVGVDCHNFTPINFEQIKEIMSKKCWKPIDHHTRDSEED
ncbi:MAG: phosphoesterase [bacterium]|nr:phosphoesterase [bacterium]